MSAGKKPFKVGICLDFPIAAARQPFLDGVRLGFDEATEAGVLERDVELVVREVEGSPRGNSFDVVQAWQSLADEGVVGIIGPLISDNSMAVKEHIDTVTRKVPTLVWSGTEHLYADYVFGMTNGSLPEEPYLMAEWLKDSGHRTVGVVYERGVIGQEYFEYFQDASEREGLQIVYVEVIGMVARDTAATMARVRERKPDALVYLGFGLPGIEMNVALAAAGWNPPRIMNSAFVFCYLAPEFMQGMGGWVGVDQYDEENTVGQEMLARFEKRFGYRQETCVTTLAYDSGAVLARGIANARSVTPVGVRDGLERVKLLPSATGGPGTRMTFGRMVRRVWHGVDYLVLREINADRTGTSLVGRFRR